MDIIKGWNLEKYNGKSNTDFGFFPNSMYLNDHWYNEFFLEYWQKAVREDNRITEDFNSNLKYHNQFRCFQFLLSPRVRHWWAIISFGIKLLPVEPNEASKLLTEDQFLPTMFLRELQNNKALNLIMLDYIENSVEFLRIIVASNYASKLEITSVKINEKDITKDYGYSRFLSLLQNIWFMNRQDLDQLGSGDLEVEFRYKGSNTTLKKKWYNIEDLEMVSIDCFDYIQGEKSQDLDILAPDKKELVSCLEEIVEEYDTNLFSPWFVMVNLIRKSFQINKFSDFTKRQLS